MYSRATLIGTPCVPPLEGPIIWKVPLTEKALATYVCTLRTYIHMYLNKSISSMKPNSLGHKLAHLVDILARRPPCGRGHIAAVVVNGEPRRHRGTFGYVGGRGRMQIFFVPGPPVAKNNGVEVERGGGGIML